MRAPVQKGRQEQHTGEQNNKGEGKGWAKTKTTTNSHRRQVHGLGKQNKSHEKRENVNNGIYMKHGEKECYK